MHGLSGSGKSTVSLAMIERLGAVRVRSDVERKRMHGLAPQARTHADPYGGIYAPENTTITYDKLKLLVREIIEAGRTAIVDAAFLWRAERDAFRALARESETRFLIVSCRAPETVLRRRIAQREAAMNDASEAGIAVLERQVATQEPLGPHELMHAVQIDSTADEAGLRGAIDQIAIRLAQGEAADALH
jgi:predicted kinase